MRVQLHTSIDELDASAWDALCGDDDPFVEHAFLSALERSGSVGAEAGWEPVHVTAWHQETLVGALPLYLKTHSYGEYIFDWSWADAASRIGIPYYPKLVSMVPVTPVTGKRLLIAEGANDAQVVQALTDGCFEAQAQTGAHSIHLLFLNAHEKALLDSDNRWMKRLSYQFHWTNRGYAGFDDLLNDFRASMRKKVRKERRVVIEAGYEVAVRAGTELCDYDWRHLYSLYRRTCAKKGSYPYLTEAFFEEAGRSLCERAVVIDAKLDNQVVAASLNFEKGSHLYGRYWGSIGEHDMLHFELCYYRLLERAIVKGMRTFQAGAQGTHKLRRGLLPTPVFSAHHIEHPVIRDAVADFLPREAAALTRQMEELAYHGPFRRDA